ncbi:MAG TPA: hypothetical protein VH331_15025 [Allosphingosinicella sp.]|jgi:hypothetical protein|nr:hypothetical protein [Allosphingosinicella sp.]
MLGSHRRYILAAIGWLILAAAPAPDNGASAEYSHTTQHKQAALNSVSATAAQVAAPANTPEDQKPCNNGQHHDLSERCAEWAAADWARDSLTVGVIGAVGIVIALLLTIDSNRIARDTAKRQLRAYMTIDGVNPFDVVAGQPILISVTIMNRGQTPAYRVRSISTMRLDVPRKSFRHQIPKIEEAGALVMGAGDKARVKAKSKPLTTEEMHNFNAGKLAIYTIGRVEYSDVFGRQHHLTFMYEADVDGIRAAIQGNEWT